MPDNHIGERLKRLRESHKLGQAEMAQMLGLKDRQSISAIELGHRRVTADELVRIIGHFEVTLDWLTNPFLLVGKKEAFSWRQKDVPMADLDNFESLAGEWIGAYRELSLQNGTPLPTLLPRLGLTYTSELREAGDAGEQVAKELDLGDRPALKLADTLQSRLGILVMMVDAPLGISGAACRLNSLNAILINRNERAGRRNSDISHEFFHIQTWMEMKPARVESSAASWEDPKTNAGLRNRKIEQLADNFAASLLMPSYALDQLPKPHGDLATWLSGAADFLGVSARSLKWRMVNSKRAPELAHVTDQALHEAKQGSGNTTLPALFSKAFVETLGKAIDQGNISIMRTARLVGLPRDELAALFESHHLDAPAEL
jgi:transcriptional regulator with XRE-family HTH domain/Zn-dependent peptidase ImmA (M78 family)